MSFRCSPTLRCLIAYTGLWMLAGTQLAAVPDSDDLPFAPYILVQLDIGVAVQERVNDGAEDCLADAGYVVSLDSPPSTPGVNMIARRYGLPEDVVLVGYSPEGDEDRQPPSYLSDPDFQRLMYGDGGGAIVEIPGDSLGDGKAVSQLGGCAGEGQAEAFGDFGQYAEFIRVSGLLDRLVRDTYHQTVSSDAYTSLVGQWSECMHEDGYSYLSPMAAMGDSWESLDEELAVVEADVACRAQIEFSGTALGIEAEFQIKRLDEYRSLVEALEPFTSELGISIGAPSGFGSIADA